MTDLSIIIPVFNREKTIEKCLNSVLDSLSECAALSAEIILVDDGSEDKSVELCKGYADKNGNIRLIENAHGGVSKARNAGISAADGKYITFIDSDDIVGKNYAAQISEAIKAEPELVLFNAHYILAPNGNFTKTAIDMPEGENQDIEKAFNPIITQKLNACWDKIYKTEIIKENGILFNDNMQVSEDYVFVLNFAAKCERVSIFPVIDYYFCFAVAGPRRMKARYIYDLIYSYSQTLDFINEKGVIIAKDTLCKRFLQLFCEFLIRINSYGKYDEELKNAVKNSQLYGDIKATKFRKPKSIIEKFIVTHGAFKLGRLFLKTVSRLERLINKAN